MFALKKIIILIFVFVIYIALSVKFAEAKLLPQAKSLGTAKTTSVKSTAVGVSAKFRKDRKAVTIYFSNLKNAASVSYSLTYETNGKNEGVGGTIKISGKNSDSRELLFGTCSSGVCTYHANIQNAKLTVTSTLASGGSSTRKFRIRI